MECFLHILVNLLQSVGAIPSFPKWFLSHNAEFVPVFRNTTAAERICYLVEFCERSNPKWNRK